MHDLCHHGILGMKWGVRRYQNKDGSLTPAGQRRLEQRDAKWAKKNYERITTKTRKAVSKEIDAYGRQLLSAPSSVTSKGKLSSTAINAYNNKLADLMNKSSKSIAAPSGRVVRFVAKRGEIGVHMALADREYDISKLKNGIWSSGRVAYKKENVNMV